MGKQLFLRKFTILTFAFIFMLTAFFPLSHAYAKEKGQQEKEQFKLREAETGFRVLPYLQSPTDTSVKISWISEFNEPGIVTLTSPETERQVVKSSPYYMDLMEYTAKELQQELTYDSGNGVMQTIPQGSWLKSNSNYKHTITLEKLKPNTTYYLHVQQGKETHRSQFKTFPTRKDWE